MSLFNLNILPVSELIKKRDTLNAKRSAWLREEGAGVCLDKDYRLLCKAINELGIKIQTLTEKQKVTF